MLENVLEKIAKPNRGLGGAKTWSRPAVNHGAAALEAPTL
jgi:hypothetical protein